MKSPAIVSALIWCVLSAAAIGQPAEDERDQVHLEDGSVLSGRIVSFHDPAGLILRRNDREETIPHARVKRTETVGKRLREFLDARRKVREQVRAEEEAIEKLSAALRKKERARLDKERAHREWPLVEQATKAKLPEMARLQAYWVLLFDPDHQGANELLNHRKKGKRWFWLWDEKERMYRSGFDARLRKKGIILESEHYRLRCHAGLDVALATLFDLETFYLDWHRDLGKILRTREVLQALDIEVSENAKRFPSLTSASIPYFEPGAFKIYSFPVIEGDRGARKRHEIAHVANLLGLATEQILYTLHKDRGAIQRIPQRLNGRSRLISHRDAVWLEIGFGAWLAGHYGGEAGYAEKQEEPKVQMMDARLALYWAAGRLDTRGIRTRGLGRRGRRTLRLEDLIGWNFSIFYQGAKSKPLSAERYWASSRAFVHFLMDEDNGVRYPDQKETTRSRFYAYIRRVFGAQGNGSSEFDKTMGGKIEAMERPWQLWLREKAK